MTFTYEQGRSIGTLVRAALRDYLRPQISAVAGSSLQRFNGFDIGLREEFENELPTQKPMVSIATTLRTPCGMGRNRNIDFVVECRILADGQSGAIMTRSNADPAHELLANCVEQVLDSDTARAALAALGLQALTLGERRESNRDGLFLVQVQIKFTATIAAQEA